MLFYKISVLNMKNNKETLKALKFKLFDKLYDDLFKIHENAFIANDLTLNNFIARYEKEISPFFNFHNTKMTYAELLSKISDFLIPKLYPNVDLSKLSPYQKKTLELYSTKADHWNLINQYKAYVESSKERKKEKEIYEENKELYATYKITNKDPTVYNVVKEHQKDNAQINIEYNELLASQSMIKTLNKENKDDIIKRSISLSKDIRQIDVLRNARAVDYTKTSQLIKKVRNEQNSIINRLKKENRQKEFQPDETKDILIKPKLYKD